jgi:hypothetical protein
MGLEDNVVKGSYLQLSWPSGNFAELVFRPEM